MEHIIFAATVQFLALAAASAAPPDPHAALHRDGVEFEWCHIVRRPDLPRPDPGEPLTRFAPVAEVEPNDVFTQAQDVGLGLGAGQEQDVIVSGSFTSTGDTDFFSFTARKGDVIGAACAPQLSPSLDPALWIHDPTGDVIFQNDDADLLPQVLPPGVPWPTVVSGTFGAAATFIVPDDGTYYVEVRGSFGLGASADYTLRLVARRPLLEQGESPARQTIFIDFDGASINVSEVFGHPFAGARSLSRLSTFLPLWGLSPADEDAVIDAILDSVKRSFDDLRKPDLNGDLPAGGPPGSFDVVFLNSRDDADPFGQPNVSRVIVGGTIDELTISTIGIAQFIDPGNYSTADTAVVLLDILSGPAGAPSSLNSIARAPGKTIIDLIGVAVGNIVSHEIGHYVGNFHTYNQSPVACLMDSGGNLANTIGLGPDLIFGTPDDKIVKFEPDDFAQEFFFGRNNTRVNTAFALSSGVQPAIPPGLINEDPPRDSFLGRLDQVSILFSEPVVGLKVGLLMVNGSEASGISGSGAGPYVFSGFEGPGDGPVTCQILAGNIKDLAGNPFGGIQFQYTIRDCNLNGTLDDEEISSGESPDCNANLVIDVCDPEALRAKNVDKLNVMVGQTIVLSAASAIEGGQEPFSYRWTLKGHSGTEASNELAPAYTPGEVGTFVPKLEITDANGCTAAAYLTIDVRENATADNQPPPGNCAQGAACGMGAGGLVTMVCAYLGVFHHRRRRK